MSELSRVFDRRQGQGWLVLAGGFPELGGPSAGWMDRLIARLDLARPIVAIVGPDAEPNEVQEFLENVEEWLGAEAGVLEADTDLEIPGWEDSGLILLVGEDREAWVDSLAGPAGERLVEAFDRGAIILAIGGAAGVFGARWVSTVRPDTARDGFAWLPAAMILTDPAEADASLVQDWLKDEEPRTAILLEAGSILALGPEGAVEIWSEAAPEIRLGTGWTAA